jgi:hypothetical protein
MQGDPNKAPLLLRLLLLLLLLLNLWERCTPKRLPSHWHWDPGPQRPPKPLAQGGTSTRGPRGTRKSLASLYRPLKQCLCMCGAREPPWQGAAAATMRVLLPLGRATCCCRCTPPLGHALLVFPGLSWCTPWLAEMILCCCLYSTNTASAMSLLLLLPRVLPLVLRQRCPPLPSDNRFANRVAVM